MIALKPPALALGIVIVSPLVGHADQVCDFEHRCYQDQPPAQHYHMDLSHPDVETPPPAPQYPSSAVQSGRDIVVQPKASEGCHLFRVRSVPSIEPQIVEICPIPADEERVIRERANSNAEAADMNQQGER
jgi:hypothetical protein